MRRGAFIAVGLTALLIAGLIFVPATVIVNLIDERLAPRVVLQAVDGTIWSGRATVAIMPVPSGGAARRETSKRNATPRALLQVPVQWSFAPSSLLRGRFGADIRMQSSELSGKLRAEAGIFNVQVRDADISASMDALSRVNQDLGLFKPSGRIEALSTDDAVTVGYAAPHPMSGSLKLSVSDVRLRAGALLGLAVPIGSYAGTVKFTGERIDYRIDSSRGMLALSGSGHITRDANRELHYDGVATPLPGSPTWLMGALVSTGRLTPDGRVNINVKTRW
jgi:hypothetical protein